MANLTSLQIYDSNSISDLNTEVQNMYEQLTRDLRRIFGQVEDAFRTIDLLDNFAAREVTLVFVDKLDLQIPNPFRSRRDDQSVVSFIPRRWIVSDVGSAPTVTFAPQRGVAPWSKDFLYLRNPPGGSISVRIIFYR